MKTQALTQRKATQKYREVQRSARSEHRSNANVVPFKCAPGVPGSAPQTLSRLDTRRLWVGLIVVICVVAGLVIAGKL